MKICLIALTGFGNPILDALVRADLCHEIVVVTEVNVRSFPHYDETPLDHRVDYWRQKDKNIELCNPDQLVDVLRKKFDLVIVATWRSKVPIPDCLAVNVHPGKLPGNGGATPTFWSIRDGDLDTAITIHQLTSEYDKGPIYYEEIVPIWGHYTDGILRAVLAAEAGVAVERLVRDLVGGKLPTPKSQDRVCPGRRKRTESDRFIGSFDHLPWVVHNTIRSVLPWPGAIIKRNDKEIRIYRSQVAGVGSCHAPGTILEVYRDGTILVATVGGFVRLLIDGDVKQGEML